jgi:EAL domain-containing protein (putative c-di-GMP-specific phosphodiesterase class I)
VAAGLAAVLVGLTGGAIWAAAAVDRSAREVQGTSAQRDAWAEARYQVNQEHSLGHAYLATANPKLRPALEEASRKLEVALGQLAAHGGPDDAAQARQIQAKHTPSLQLLHQMLDAVDAKDMRTANEIHLQRVHPVYTDLGETTVALAAREQAQATAALTELRRPGEFIPLAERTGLIHPLTRWVLDAALRQAAEWHRGGHRLSIAVNVSTRCLLDPSFPDQVTERLAAWEVPAGSLMLEVTESAVMADPARALDVLGRLHAMGVKLAVDDFGTGYSSMAYLKALPVDELKVDRSFVGQMASNTSDAVIVRSTIDLGHNLGLRVVAEGVETQEAWQDLAALGCDTAQGYYLGRPMPATDLERWLDRPASHPSEL